MALKKFGFIVKGAGLDPAIHRLVMASPEFEMIAVGVASVQAAGPVAQALIDEGIELLELCGGFGAPGTAAVLSVVDDRIPVGAVGYGPESIDGMHRLFAPA